MLLSPLKLRATRLLRRERSAPRGMTLLELTVVILVLMSLITILFIGAKAWKRGSDRALCIMHIQFVQKGVRSYSNLYGMEPGVIAPDLRNHIIGIGKFVDNTPVCPGQGNYTYGESSGTDMIPPVGELYMQCSLATADSHVPQDHSEW